MVCLLVVTWIQLSVSASNGWPHNALRHHWLMPISGHFRDCKALLVTSVSHVSGAIASPLPLPLFWNNATGQDVCNIINLHQKYVVRYTRESHDNDTEHLVAHRTSSSFRHNGYSKQSGAEWHMQVGCIAYAVTVGISLGGTGLLHFWRESKVLSCFQI